MKNVAQWIQHTHVFRDDDYECSSCGCISEAPYAICPSCGKQMKGSKYDPSWVDEMEGLSAILDDDW